VPIEWSWRSFVLAAEPMLSQYSLAPIPGVQEIALVARNCNSPPPGPPRRPSRNHISCQYVEAEHRAYAADWG
jgi:hypothetical protein